MDRRRDGKGWHEKTTGVDMFITIRVTMAYQTYAMSKLTLL